VHFQNSERGREIMIGFLVSCSVLLVISSVMYVFPSVWPYKKTPGVPVKDYISQSAMFGVCIAIALYLALAEWRRSRIGWALAYALLAIAFQVNIFCVATSRTALIVMPVVLLLFGLKQLNWKWMIGLLAAYAALAAVSLYSSAFMKQRVGSFLPEVTSYQTESTRTPAGERLEYWKKSIIIISSAPVFGHGTGTITEQYRRLVSDQSELSRLVSSNPHNQTLAVAIQLGLLGAIPLFAMWLAHLLLFRGEGLAAWIGLAVVVQNVVSSLFNSHLFDFTHGWAYVLGVGIAGGIVLKRAVTTSAASG